EHLRVLLGPAVGGGDVGRIGNSVPELLAGAFGGREVLVRFLERRFQGSRLLDLLLGGRLAEALLLGAQLFLARRRLAPARVRLQQPVEELLAALANERSPKRLRLG